MVKSIRPSRNDNKVLVRTRYVIEKKKWLLYSQLYSLIWITYLLGKLFVLRAGALVSWLWKETRVPKVVGSNPGTVYWMDIFSHILVVKIVMLFV